MNKYKLELFLRNCVQKQRINCAYVYVKTYNVLTPGQKCLKKCRFKVVSSFAWKANYSLPFRASPSCFHDSIKCRLFSKILRFLFLKKKKKSLFAECTLSKIPRRQKQKSSRKQFVKCGKIHVNWLLWRFV